MRLSLWVFWPVPLKNSENTQSNHLNTPVPEGYLPADSSSPASTPAVIYKLILNILIQFTLKFRVVVELYSKEALQDSTTLALETIKLKKN